jgi:L-ascorbate metabolism protein UlaG (beta-lactamase superfamily)
MPYLYRVIRKVFILVILLTALLIIAATMFITFSPQFGGKHSKQSILDFNQSGRYKHGRFYNEVETEMDFSLGKVFSEFLRRDPRRNPVSDVPVLKLGDSFFNENKGARLTWFGHSAFLLELNGKRILLDPMLGESPAPHPLIGPKRYSKELPIEIEKMPFIDAVILSHDHYDHLDYGSIKKLKHKVGMFYTPLGVGSHLYSWGIAREKIKELNWWDETSLGDLRFVCTPARHFSGRAFTDRFNTLWASWVILAGDHRIYFSGDSGYGPHFKTIGEKLGPFDIAMMECGQYNENWKNIHMMPEETAQAGIDLQSELILPIHWGAFSLAFHSWTDPVNRVISKAEQLGIPVATPRIGESMILGAGSYPTMDWWCDVD